MSIWRKAVGVFSKGLLWIEKKYSLVIFNLKKLGARIFSSLVKFITSYLFTILAFVIAITLLGSKKIGVDNYNATLLAIGGLIGTILVLASTLTIIPVQRASEDWSTLISKLYSDDIKIKSAFATLCAIVFVLLTFSTAKDGFFNSFLYSSFLKVGDKELMIFVSIICIGATLDLIRWFYVYVCDLLNPITAISVMRAYAKKMLLKVNKKITSHAKFISHQSKTEAHGTIPVSQIGLNLYQSININPVSQYVDAIAEIAIKAINRRERLFANEAISCLANIANDYFDIRKDTIILAPRVALLIGGEPSNISPTLNRINESLRIVSEYAISEKNEPAINSIAHAYIAICKHVSQLKEGSSVLFFSPLFYLKLHIAESEKNGFIDCSFQSTESVLTMAISLNATLPVDDVYALIMEWFSERAIQYFIKSRPEFANEVSKRMMLLLHHVYIGDMRDRDMFLSQTLNLVKGVVSYAIFYEATQVGFHPNSLCSGVYSLSYEYSLGYLFQNIADREREKLLIWSDEAHSQLYDGLSGLLPRLQDDAENCYLDLVIKEVIIYNFILNLNILERERFESVDRVYDCIVNTSEEIRNHFRSLAESELCEFGGTRLLGECISTIKYIGNIFIFHIEEIINDDDSFSVDSKLVNELKWNLSFLWAAFDKKKTVNFTRANEACDVLAYIGLKFINISWHTADVIDYCCNQILTVAILFANQEKKPEQHLIFNLLIYSWYLRLVSKSYGFTHVVNKIDDAFSKFFSKMEPVFQQAYNLYIEPEKRQIERQISDARFSSRIYTDKAFDLLIRLINAADSAK